MHARRGYPQHAARQYANCADPFVGTEHVLFFLATDPGSRARRVLNDLNVDIADIKRELECWVVLTLRAAVPPRRGSNVTLLSFYGKQRHVACPTTY